MTARNLWQKLRVLWDSDKRLDTLENTASAARLDRERQGAQAASALASAAAELRAELAEVTSGLKALAAVVSSVDDERRRQETEQRARESGFQARQAEQQTRQDEHEAGMRRLAVTLQAGLDRIQSTVESLQADVRSPEPWRQLSAALAQMRHVVAHQAGQLDLLKSSLEVDRTLIDELQAWKSTHALSARPLVSVCIPTYNRARLLVERCLPSILGQTYDHLDIVVVGDGCTDDTAERIRGLRDPRVRFMNLPQRGDYPADPLRRWMVAGTFAVNKALARARGELITHLDDDDEYLPERLAKLVSFMLEERCDLVWHPFWYEDPDGRWLLNDADQFAFSRVTTSSVLYRSWFKKVPWDAAAHLLLEPGDWNRFRRLRYVGAVCRRFPEPLLRHYRERRPAPDSGGTAN
jgi:hypothetical protein